MTQAKGYAISSVAAVLLAMVAIGFTPGARAADAGNAAPANSNCSDIYHCPNYATTGQVSNEDPTRPTGAKAKAAPLPTDAMNASPASPNCFPDVNHCASYPTGDTTKENSARPQTQK